MEMLIVLFILALSEKNAEVKETLKSVLDFYRQNRELLTAMASMHSAPETGETAHVSEQKSSPDPGGDSLRIIEEFLKRKTL